MPYNISILSPLEREALIKKSVQTPEKHEEFWDFRNTLYKLPVIRIGINVPVYRMENFRTFTDQQEFITLEKKTSTFFSKGQENESVQQKQHELLFELAQKGKEGSITPVIDVLRKSKQRETLLITATGVVVNGNRRLAAMRELFSEGSAETASFSHVNVMVLPSDATSEEIIDTEASLQGKQETKLDYDWIGDAKMIAQQVKIHKSTYNVAQRLNRNEKDIKNAIQALAEADLYLKEWASATGEYSRIKDDAEQFFKDLPKRLEGKDTQLENASRAIAWSLFENRERLDRRIYDFNPAFGKLASDVLERFATSVGIPIDQQEDEQEDDDFAIDIQVEDGTVSYDLLIETLKDKENSETIGALIEACEDALESDKGQKSGDAALRAISQAHSKLTSVDLSRASVATYLSISKQLDGIYSLTAKLKETLKALSK